MTLWWGRIDVSRPVEGSGTDYPKLYVQLMRSTDGAMDMAAIDDLSWWHFWDLVSACGRLNQEEDEERIRRERER